MLYIRPEKCGENAELHKQLQESLENFGELFKLVPSECTKFLFVIQPKLGKGPELEEFLRKIAPYIYKTECKNEWPGTKLLSEDKGTVYYGYLCDDAKIVLAEVGGFQDLGQPRSFEDFALLREDEKWWLSSITHSNAVFLD